MHRYIRHPNYTGEMMIYGGLALLVWHWIPFVVLAWVWIGLFLNMVVKEASMSRYPEWAAYKAHEVGHPLRPVELSAGASPTARGSAQPASVAATRALTTS